MFGWEYPPHHLGGLGVACQGLVEGLISNGVRVTLVLPHAHSGGGGALNIVSPTSSELSEIRVCSLLSPYQTADQYDSQINTVDESLANIYGHNMGEAIEKFTEMSVEMTKDVEADVVHCHDWMTYEAGRRAARYHRKPLVAHIHATELDRTNFQPNEYIYAREKRGFEAADKIIAVSHYTKGILQKYYGISGDKIAVLHNGSSEQHPHIDHITSQYLQKKQHPLILFLGRLVLQKGAVQFLEMAEHVHAQRPDVQFVMAGDGPMLPELVDRAIGMGLQDSVVFAGKVSREETRKLYAKADCFVMSSLSEPFGLVALEAIAHGTPVVLSKQSGAAEVVSDCFSVDFWDTDKMADCVLTILREEPLALQLISQAPRTLQRLTWQNQAGNLRSMYHDVITSSLAQS
jgi:glycosyltransferase involved in cell wall biosynthesis